MTMRTTGMAAVLVGVMSVVVPAQQRGGRATPARPATPPSVVRQAACSNPLGKGVKTAREFCDVIVAPTGAGSVAMEIPPHTGPATLFFDLHPRFEVTGPDSDPARLYQRHRSVIAVVGPTGDVIDRFAAEGEFRSTADLYDRMAGTIPGGFKVVAPGPLTPIRAVIPAGIPSVGIVGLRVEITSRFGQQAYPQPGLPVAIVSNWRIEYTPR